MSQPNEILASRLARGEITKQEYLDLIEVIQDKSPDVSSKPLSQTEVALASKAEVASPTSETFLQCYGSWLILIVLASFVYGYYIQGATPIRNYRRYGIDPRYDSTRLSIVAETLGGAIAAIILPVLLLLVPHVIYRLIAKKWSMGAYLWWYSAVWLLFILFGLYAHK